MSPSNVAFLLGTILFVLGRRFAVFDGYRVAVAVVALGLAYGVAGALRFLAYRKQTDPGERYGHRVAFVLLGLTAIAVGIYALTIDEFVRRLGLSDAAEATYLALLGWLWPMVWLLGAVPLATVDWAIQSSPVVVPNQRIRALTAHGIIIAMGVTLVFPINWIANERSEHWDLAYFKTPVPGGATRALAESLEQPIDVRVFSPPASDVARELRHYFDALEGPNVRVTYVDQAVSPRLAKALRVRENGVVTFTAGEIDLDEADAKTDAKADAADEPEEKKPEPITRTLRVGAELEKAKRTLKKLDVEVQKLLIELGHGERVAYVTTGHGELSYRGSADGPPGLDKMRSFKERLGQLGFTVKPLGPAEGLADGVPEDADVVLVLGPKQSLAPTEVDSLRTYLRGGGSLLIALDPLSVRTLATGQEITSGGAFDEFVEQELGLRVGDGVLASDKQVVPLSRGPQDRLFTVTTSFTSHASNRVLPDNPGAALFTPFSGHLEEIPGHASSITFTVRSLAFTWADLGEIDLQYEPEKGESKSARQIVAAVTGGDTNAPWRAVVAGGSGIFSDIGFFLLGNVQFVDDPLNWLIGAEALSGTTESEEDVKIEHTREGQAGWFYLTVLGVPFGVLALGALRVRWRRRGPTAAGPLVASAPSHVSTESVDASYSQDGGAEGAADSAAEAGDVGGSEAIDTNDSTTVGGGEG